MTPIWNKMCPVLKSKDWKAK